LPMTISFGLSSGARRPQLALSVLLQYLAV
jgi:hypothetical protein